MRISRRGRKNIFVTVHRAQYVRYKEGGSGGQAGPERESRDPASVGSSVHIRLRDWARTAVVCTCLTLQLAPHRYRRYNLGKDYEDSVDRRRLRAHDARDEKRPKKTSDMERG